MAEASTLRLSSEYSEPVSRMAPDDPRKMVKPFTAEEGIHLAATLNLTKCKQTTLLTQNVLSLAGSDQYGDTHDGAHFTRQLIIPPQLGGALSHRRAKNLSFLASKPAPALKSSFKDRDRFQRHSLSHLLNAKATGSQELPDGPEEATRLSVCNMEVSEWTKAQILRRGRGGET